VRKSAALVLVADRNRLVAEALMDAFLEVADVDVKVATSLGEAQLTTQRMRPDLVLVDVWMVRSGVEDLVRQLKECAPDARVFVMASHIDAGLEQRALRAGAAGCLVKLQVPGAVTAMLDALEVGP
jgi:DNA-binding NarL/FixJ family response regulator